MSAKRSKPKFSDGEVVLRRPVVVLDMGLHLRGSSGESEYLYHCSDSGFYWESQLSHQIGWKPSTSREIRLKSKAMSAKRSKPQSALGKKESGKQARR